MDRSYRIDGVSFGIKLSTYYPVSCLPCKQVKCSSRISTVAVYDSVQSNAAEWRLPVPVSVPGGAAQAQERRARDRMLEAGDRAPSVVTYSTVIDGLCKADRLDDAYLVLQKMRSSGCVPDVVTYTAIIDAFCKVGRLDEARELFQRMHERGCALDVVAYNILIRGYCRAAKVDDAIAVIEEMAGRGVQPNVVSLSTIVDGLCKESRVEDARVLMEKMNFESLPSDG